MSENDVFCMLTADDKLDGNNYPLWAYMMHHVLVSKGFWNIVQAFDVHLGSVDYGTIENVASTSTSGAAAVLPTIKQVHWDGRDAQAHALITLSMKHTIVPHIRLAKIAKQAWDILAHLYARRNEAHVAYLRKQLESKHMEEGNYMDIFLTEIKDLKGPHLITIDEIILDSSLVQIVLDALPDSYLKGPHLITID